MVIDILRQRKEKKNLNVEVTEKSEKIKRKRRLIEEHLRKKATDREIESLFELLKLSDLKATS